MIRKLIEFSSFGDGGGDISFNKMVTFTALWCFVVVAVASVFLLKQQPSVATWSFGLGCVAAGFGLKGLMAYLARRTDNFSQADKFEVKADVAEVIKALKTRDPEQGYQPSGKVPQVYDD